MTSIGVGLDEGQSLYWTADILIVAEFSGEDCALAHNALRKIALFLIWLSRL